MATFERVDLVGDQNDGPSVIYITNQFGAVVELTMEEAKQLLHWLYSELEEVEETTARLPTLPE